MGITLFLNNGVMAAIQITSIHLWSCTRKLVLIDRAFVALRFAPLVFTRVTFVPGGFAEWAARVDSFPRLAIGAFAHLSLGGVRINPSFV